MVLGEYNIIDERFLCESLDICKILDKTAENVIQLSVNRKLKISVAESCTGGMISSALTAVSGASACIELGVCSYSDRIKNEILGVEKEILEKYTAVSPHVALQMARGVKKLSSSNIALSVTGIAGPTGGTPETPVGTVYLGFVCDEFERVFLLSRFYGFMNKQRENIRLHTAAAALLLTEEYLFGGKI